MKAIVFLADGFEEIEALSPVDYLRRSGVEVTTVSVLGNSVVHGAHKVDVIADCSLKQFIDSGNIGEIDAVVVPGGMPGASNIASNSEALDIIQKIFDSGKLVAAICASPAVVLGQTNVLNGKKWCCYPGMDHNAGNFTVSYDSSRRVIADGNLITAIGPGAAEEFSVEIVNYLRGSEVKSKVFSAAQIR